MVSVFAVNTVSYYMLEFRNEVVEHWMMQFANYSKFGFRNGDWTQHIEEMIKTSDHKVQVIMRPPKNLLRGKHEKLGQNIVIQYDTDIGSFFYKCLSFRI